LGDASIASPTAFGGAASAEDARNIEAARQHRRTPRIGRERSTWCSLRADATALASNVDTLCTEQDHSAPENTHDDRSVFGMTSSLRETRNEARDRPGCLAAHRRSTMGA
jgi:hypothetical protein